MNRKEELRARLAYLSKKSIKLEREVLETEGHLQELELQSKMEKEAAYEEMLQDLTNSMLPLVAVHEMGNSERTVFELKMIEAFKAINTAIRGRDL